MFMMFEPSNIILILGGLVLMAGIVINRGNRNWKPDPGRCPSCGYDVRATPERCPECGWKVPVDE